MPDCPFPGSDPLIDDSQGGVFSSGDNTFGQLRRSSGDEMDDYELQRIMNIPPMVVASCGWYHTLSIDENGDGWTGDVVTLGNWGRMTLPISSNPLLPLR